MPHLLRIDPLDRGSHNIKDLPDPRPGGPPADLMSRPLASKPRPHNARPGAGRMAVRAAVGLLLLATPALAQGWNWPFGAPPEDRPKPVPRAPAWRPPDPPSSPPPAAAPGPGGWASRNSNVCLELEQRLVQEGQKGGQAQSILPQLETQIRQAEQQLRAAQTQLDRGDCYDFFLFSKTLRRTKKCVDASREVESLKSQLADLNAQRQQIVSTSGRSYQDEIIRELARNNCGAGYAQEARKRDGAAGPFSSVWQEEESSGAGGLGNYGNLGYATYRTLCVRLCDGYYFPISFSTLPNHFERDAEMCQSKCAAPAGLYYHQNPGAGVDQMLALGSNEPYTQLKSAFRYRKEYVQGCSCKQAEYLPPAGGPQSAPPLQKSEGGGSTTGEPLTTGSTVRSDDGTAGSAWSAETSPQ